jgi:hypothetical protein
VLVYAYHAHVVSSDEANFMTHDLKAGAFSNRANEMVTTIHGSLRRGDRARFDRLKRKRSRHRFRARENTPHGPGF